MEAQRQVEATQKAVAATAAQTGQNPGPRPEKRDRAPSIETLAGSEKKAKTDDAAPAPTVPTSPALGDFDMRTEGPPKNPPTSFNHLVNCRLPCAIKIDKKEIIGSPFTCIRL